MQVWVIPPRVLGCLSNGARTTAWFVLCTNLNSLYPLGIVKGRQQRQRQTWRKYPINLQDISCKASFHTANDVTLCASMSKCHNKLLHIIQCFYLMMALCVGCVISSLRLCCCGVGSMVIKECVRGRGEQKTKLCKRLQLLRIMFKSDYLETPASTSPTAVTSYC